MPQNPRRDHCTPEGISVASTIIAEHREFVKYHLFDKRSQADQLADGNKPISLLDEIGNKHTQCIRRGASARMIVVHQDNIAAFYVLQNII